jgi:predicted RNA binding protein YcfA (HicA-like mRNA interferase family)
MSQAVTGKSAVVALQQIEFSLKGVQRRFTGCRHRLLRHQDGRTIVIPVQPNETLGSGILSKILKDCDMTREAFQDLL